MSTTESGKVGRGRALSGAAPGRSRGRVGWLAAVLVVGGAVAPLAASPAAANGGQSLSTVAASPSAGSAVCRTGFPPPQCLAAPFASAENLALAGNGFAKPAVARDVIPGYPTIHQPQFANDGYYGNGASWIGNSSNSWLKIDLGRVVRVDRIKLGRDRTGNFEDRDPGRFTIAAALSDDAYANGNDGNDGAEYAQVFDSAAVGFGGAIAGPQTLQAGFTPVLARFVKVTVANGGAAIDEVEVLGTVDATPPSITGTRAPGPNGLGWNNGDVTVSFQCADDGFGVASCSGPTTLTAEGANQSVAGTATDKAGNSASATVGGISIDKTAPAIAIASPAGQRYVLNQSVLADYACTDDGSGVAACAGSVPSGSPLATGAVGAHSLRVDAADRAGNAATRTGAYTVGYGVCVLHDETKAVRSGATIPIKLQLCDASGANASSSAITVTALGVTRVSDAASSEVIDAGSANPENNFRYAAGLGGTGGYIFNLSTKGLATGTYRLTFAASGDPGTHATTFQVR